AGGAHAWNGTAATLNASPATTSTAPTRASGVRPGPTPAASASASAPRWTTPVAAYSKAAPSSVTAAATTETTNIVSAPSAEAVLRRRRPTSAYSGRVRVSSATISVIRSRAYASATPPASEQASRKQYSPAGRSRTARTDSASTPRVSSANSTAIAAETGSAT